MELFRYLFKTSRSTILAAVFFGILSGLASTAMITTIHQAIEPEASAHLVWLFAGAALLFLVTSVGGQVPLFHLSEGAVFKLRLHLVRRILATPLRGLEELGSHRLYASLAGDINAIADGFVNMPKVIINASTLLGCVAYLAWLSPFAFLYLAGFFVLMVLIYMAAMGRAMKRLGRSREVGDHLFSHFGDLTEGAKELKLSGNRRDGFVEQLVEPTAETYRRNRIAGLTAIEIANVLGNMSYFIVIGLMIFAVPRWQSLNPEVVSGSVLIFIFMMMPLTALLGMTGSIANASISLAKVKALGLQNLDPDHQEAPHVYPQKFRRLELQGVTHTYFNERQDESFTMGPVSLYLKPGEVVFLTGGNGSGKSTLAKLITGLYEPEAGSICLDGEPVTPARLQTYRHLFSVVFADFHLFDRLLGMNSLEADAQISDYLKMLHLNHKVSIKEGRLSTTDLSTGQRKRLALLVAYLEDRPIYLFDEWASDQDPAFKDFFYMELLPGLRARGKAVLAITHDDRYFPEADRLLKLSDGQLVEQTPAPDSVPQTLSIR